MILYRKFKDNIERNSFAGKGEWIIGGGGGGKGYVAPPSQIIGGGGGWPPWPPSSYALDLTLIVMLMMCCLFLSRCIFIRNNEIKKLKFGNRLQIHTYLKIKFVQLCVSLSRSEWLVATSYLPLFLSFLSALLKRSRGALSIILKKRFWRSWSEWNTVMVL